MGDGNCYLPWNDGLMRILIELYDRFAIPKKNHYFYFPY